MSAHTHYPVIIVGAGPGGLAVAAALLDQGLSAKELLVLDKGEIGQSWLDYPTDTRLLSESAPHQDDNQIAGVATSEVFPHIPHPNHLMYQKYLAHVAAVKQIPTRLNSQVAKVIYDGTAAEFWVVLRDGTHLTAQFLVWAAGMYATPRDQLMMEGCYIHYAKMPYMEDIEGKEITVVGSANGASGVVMLLARPGRKVTLICSHAYEVPQPIDCLWKENMAFVQQLQKQGLVDIVEHFRVQQIYKEDHHYVLVSQDGQRRTAADKPIICTGFLPNIGPVAHLVDQVCDDHEHRLELDQNHQSTKQPGLYFAGVVGRRPEDSGFIVSFREYGAPIATHIRQQYR